MNQETSSTATPDTTSQSPDDRLVSALETREAEIQQAFLGPQRVQERIEQREQEYFARVTQEESADARARDIAMEERHRQEAIEERVLGFDNRPTAQSVAAKLENNGGNYPQPAPTIDLTELVAAKKPRKKRERPTAFQMRMEAGEKAAEETDDRWSRALAQTISESLSQDDRRSFNLGDHGGLHHVGQQALLRHVGHIIQRLVGQRDQAQEQASAVRRENDELNKSFRKAQTALLDLHKQSLASLLGLGQPLGGAGEDVITFVRINPSDKIATIKLLRELTNLGLKEAKDVIDHAASNPGTKFKRPFDAPIPAEGWAALARVKFSHVGTLVE